MVFSHVQAADPGSAACGDSLCEMVEPAGGPLAPLLTKQTVAKAATTNNHCMNNF